MNYRVLSRLLGIMTLGLGASMLPSLLCATIYREWPVSGAFLTSMAIIAAIGGVLMLLGRNASTKMFQREALGLVAGTWIMASVLGALPYVATGTLGLVDALFECVSGFSTTGSSVMTDIEGAPKGILFWRSFTHWLGGVGIVVLFVAVLPYLGAGGKLLFKSESSGPDKRGMTPRIKDTALALLMIYCALTVANILALLAAGMSLFDAMCHAFGTLSSGGFSTMQLSILAYDSLPIEIVSIVFMIFAGTSFATFYAMSRGDWLSPFKDSEWRLYISLLAIFTLLIALNLSGMAGVYTATTGQIDVGTQHESFGRALREAAFQVVSMQTNTGLISADFDRWPEFSRALLVAIMFLGGCAGSTTAGLKIIRVIILVKMVYARVERMFRPKMVRVIRVNNHIVDEDVQLTVFCFAALLFGWFIFGTLFMSLLGLPLQTAASAVACTLNGTGPGLEHVGAVMDFHTVPDAGKIFLSLTMLMGRLEIFTLLILFVPAFWKRD